MCSQQLSRSVLDVGLLAILAFITVVCFLPQNATAGSPADIDRYIQLLESGDAPAQKVQPVLWKIRDMGKDGSRAVPSVMKYLVRPEEYIRSDAFETLKAIVSADNVPFLISELNAPEDSIRAAAETLKAIVEADSELNVPEDSIRAAADLLLAQSAVLNASAPAEPLLLKNLEDPNPDVQAGAAYALGKLKSQAAVPTLRRLLFAREPPGPKSYKGWRLNELAALALGDIGPAARDAIPDLRLILESGNTRMQGFAGEALGKIGDHEDIQRLIDIILSAHDSSCRQAACIDAVDDLARLQAKQAIPILIKELREWTFDGTSNYRAHVARALGILKAEEAIPVLKEALRDDYNLCSPPLPMDFCYSVRNAARKALQEIGTPAALKALKPWWQFW